MFKKETNTQKGTLDAARVFRHDQQPERRRRQADRELDLEAREKPAESGKMLYIFCFHFVFRVFFFAFHQPRGDYGEQTNFAHP